MTATTDTTTPDMAPERLYLMELMRRMIPLPDGGTRGMVVVCYLVQTTDGQNILIDSGLPADLPQQPGMPPPIHERDVIAQLADLGLQPSDIGTVIATHFDLDHAGNHEAFTNAEFVVQRAHYETARGGYERFARSRDHWDAPALRYRTVDSDTELLPGLMLIETSGHVPGHQSVLVRLPHTGAVLLTIDAVQTQSLFTPDRDVTPNDADLEGVRASTRKLLALVEREQVTLVVFGHDADQWQTLKKAPAYYD